MLKTSIAVALAVLALSGCTAIQGMQARDAGNILAQAGFTREAPAQSASGASAGTLPARQLTRTSANTYQFYDPNVCQCIYTGGENEFARLQELRKQRAADHAWYLQRSNAISVAPHPDTWGAWAPEGLNLR